MQSIVRCLGYELFMAKAGIVTSTGMHIIVMELQAARASVSHFPERP